MSTHYGHRDPVFNDDGTVSTVTYVLEAENDLTASTYLEGLAVRPEQHFKGSVFATVKFEATREVGTGDSVVEIPLAAVDKGPLVFDTETGLVIGGPLEIQFLPDPDGVSGYDLGPEDSERRDLDNLEDNSIPLWSLFVESFDPSADLSDVDAADLVRSRPTMTLARFSTTKFPISLTVRGLSTARTLSARPAPSSARR